jgi:hypothetical protein
MDDGATGANVGGDEEAGPAGVTGWSTAGETGTGGRWSARDPEAGARASARHFRWLADRWTGLDRGWQAAALGVLVVLGHVLVRVA